MDGRVPEGSLTKKCGNWNGGNVMKNQGQAPQIFLFLFFDLTGNFEIPSSGFETP